MTELAFETSTKDRYEYELQYNFTEQRLHWNVTLINNAGARTSYLSSRSLSVDARVLLRSGAVVLSIHGMEDYANHGRIILEQFWVPNHENPLSMGIYDLSPDELTFLKLRGGTSAILFNAITMI